MFEKEAEEYVKAFTDRSHIWSNDKLMQLQLREAYKDGAEFVYNKANEWHYPSKGEYPKENLECLCIDKVWTVQTFTTILKCCDGVFIDGNGTPCDVIAWKEITPPELEEKNK